MHSSTLYPELNRDSAKSRPQNGTNHSPREMNGERSTCTRISLKPLADEQANRRLPHSVADLKRFRAASTPLPKSPIFPFAPLLEIISTRVPSCNLRQSRQHSQIRTTVPVHCYDAFRSAFIWTMSPCRSNKPPRLQMRSASTGHADSNATSRGAPQLRTSSAHLF